MKIRLFSCLLLLSLCLSSCSFVSGYSEPEDRYIVAAMGFDMIEGFLEVSVQIVGRDEILIRTGRGENARAAMSHIVGADGRQLEISHCALIIVGDGVVGSSLSDVFDYCRKNNDITVGVKVAAAYNAREILSLGVDGYELLGAVRDGIGGVGFAQGSRFYEIDEVRSEGGVYHLPYFETDGDIYTVSGLRLLDEGGVNVKLDRSESAYYMMIKGELKGGSMDVEYGGKKESVYLGGSKTEYRSEGDRTYVSCSLKVNGELLFADKKKVEEAITQEASRFFEELCSRYGDVFGFGEDKTVVIKCRLKEEKR